MKCDCGATYEERKEPCIFCDDGKCNFCEDGKVRVVSCKNPNCFWGEVDFDKEG